ncbi:MAG: protein kinase [Planctomycetota bacterium]|nr:protein kinase [Planctomycetota bacterium]
MDRRKVRELFADACDLPPDERTGFVREHSADQSVVVEVLRLLGVVERASDGLARPTLAGIHLSDDSKLDIGDRIGPYRIVKRIGEGGFGVVFLAEQSEPVQRLVAIKIIKPGMDSKQVIARFEAERQALALMDHPNIARVFDAGTTAREQGSLPYFVMELVRGVPITRYCDEKQLSIRQRLELLVPVCNAVQHAHQKGVIHRDIKPGNVLVMVQDGVPVPKVIDFGIAKATRGGTSDRTVLTELRQLVGTPAYMSPEQADLTGIDIDTRSDIYSLGVLMYELMTGTTPFDTMQVREAGLSDIQRMIKEVDPPQPSRRLTQMGEKLEGVAALRGTPADRLSRVVRGELDWIAMRAMEKDRTRRYDSAAGLGRDIERYLNGEPVHAAPPSRTYLLRKFVRRNRLGVVAGLLIALTLVLGIVGTSLGFLRAKRSAEAAESQGHRRTLAAASAAMGAGDSTTAARLLASIPESQRAWEWHYLDARTDVATQRVALPEPAEYFIWTQRSDLTFLSLRGESEMLLVVDMRRGEVVRELKGHDISLAQDGKTLLTMDASGVVTCSDVDSGEIAWRTEAIRPSISTMTNMIEANTSLSTAYAVSPDGSFWIVSTSTPDGKPIVQTRSMADGSLIREIAVPPEQAGLAELCVHLGKTIMWRPLFCDPLTGELVKRPIEWVLHGQPRFTRRTTLNNSDLTVFDDANNLVFRLPHTRGVQHRVLDISASLSRAISCDVEGLVASWRIAPGPTMIPEGRVPLATRLRLARFSADESTLIGLSEDFRSLVAFPASANQAIVMGWPDVRFAFGASHDRRRLFSLGWGDFLACNTETLMPEWRLNVGSAFGASVAVRPDDRFALALFAALGSDTRPTELHAIDLENRSVVWSLGPAPVRVDPKNPPAPVPWSGLASAVAFSADGERALVAMTDRSAVIIDPDTGAVRGRMTVPRAASEFRPSPDNTMIVATDWDRAERQIDTEDPNLWVLSTADFQPLFSIALDAAPMSSAWSEDGKLLAAASRSGRIFLIDVARRRVLWSAGPVRALYGIALVIPRDSNRVLALTQAGDIVVFDTLNGDLMGELRAGSTIGAIAFPAPDGTDIVYAGESTPVERLETRSLASSPEALERARTRAGWNILGAMKELDPFLPPEEFAAVLSALPDVPLPVATVCQEIHRRMGRSIRWSNSQIIATTSPTDTPRSVLMQAERIAASNVATAPALWGVRATHASMLMKLERYADALDVWTEVRSRMPVDSPFKADIMFSMMLAQARLGRLDEARASRAEVLKLAPQMPESSRAMQDAFAEMRQVLD